MKSSDIIKRLKQDGWRKCVVKGSHEKYKHPNKTGHVIVPHPRKDIPIGTLKHIFRQADWDWKE